MADEASMAGAQLGSPFSLCHLNSSISALNPSSNHLNSQELSVSVFSI